MIRIIWFLFVVSESFSGLRCKFYFTYLLTCSPKALNTSFWTQYNDAHNLRQPFTSQYQHSTTVMRYMYRLALSTGLWELDSSTARSFTISVCMYRPIPRFRNAFRRLWVWLASLSSERLGTLTRNTDNIITSAVDWNRHIDLIPAWTPMINYTYDYLGFLPRSSETFGWLSWNFAWRKELKFPSHAKLHVAMTIYDHIWAFPACTISAKHFVWLSIADG